MAEAMRPSTPENKGLVKRAAKWVAAPLAAGLLSLGCGAGVKNTGTATPKNATATAVSRSMLLPSSARNEIDQMARRIRTAPASTQPASASAPYCGHQRPPAIIRGPVMSCPNKNECVLLSLVKKGDSLLKITDGPTGNLFVEVKISEVSRRGVAFIINGPAGLSELFEGFKVTDGFSLNYDGTRTQVPRLVKRTYLNWGGWKVKRTADPKVAEVILPRNLVGIPAPDWTQKTETKTLSEGGITRITNDGYIIHVTRIDERGVEFRPYEMAIFMPITGECPAKPAVRVNYGEACIVMGMLAWSVKAEKGEKPGTAKLTITATVPKNQ